MTRRRETALAVGAGLLGGIVTVLAGRGIGFAVPWAVGLVAGLALGVLAAAFLRLPLADPPPDPPAAPRSRPGTVSFGDLGALRFTVEQDSRDPDRFETRLRPRLCALAAERLAQRHGIDWRTGPGREAALPLLGPDLTRLLTAPPHTLRATPQSLARWVADLEAL